MYRIFESGEFPTEGCARQANVYPGSCRGPVDAESRQPEGEIQPSATDGVHLTSEGIALYSRLIARAVRVGGAGAGS